MAVSPTCFFLSSQMGELPGLGADKQLVTFYTEPSDEWEAYFS